MAYDFGPSLTVVIVLDHAFVSGGQAKVAIESAIGLKACGHEPIVFAASGPIDPSLEQAGVRVVCLDQFDLVGNPSKINGAIQGIWNGDAAARLGKLLATLPSERTVVHVHGWAKALSPSIARPIATSGLPAIYTMHEYFLLCPNGGFYNYQAHHACPLKPLSAQCWATNCDSRNYPRKLWRNVRQLVMERVADLPRVFSDYICISNFQLDIIEPYLPAGARLHRISNPIATIDLGQKSDPASGDIVFVGRLSPEKGPFLFAEAARRLGRVPVFIGDGPVKGEIEARYPEARLLGWQEGHEVRATLRNARALVFPSLWYEGQPLTVLEAKSLGTPVLISDGCAGRDEIEDGVSGLWFSNNDADALAGAMRRLDDDATVAAMSRAAYTSFWSDPPTVERHVAAVTQVYRALTGTTAAARVEEAA